MKTIFKNTAVIVILLSSIVTMANGPEKALDKKISAKSEVEKNIITLKSEPTFKRKGKKVLLNLLNLSEGKVILKVIDSEGREVYKEEIDGDLVVEKAFNFNKAYSDEYTVVVIDESGTYKEKIEVK